jgi:hypothetical protein
MRLESQLTAERLRENLGPTNHDCWLDREESPQPWIDTKVGMIVPLWSVDCSPAAVACAPPVCGRPMEALREVALAGIRSRGGSVDSMRFRR